MADLIEIGVEVRTNSVKSANREIDSLGKTLKSAERSASAFVEAFARQERQVAKASQANKNFANTAQSMYNDILKVNQATKSASDSASVFAAENERVSASYNKLKMSIDPVFASQQKMKVAHAQIRAALKQEVITRDEAADSLRKYRTVPRS